MVQGGLDKSVAGILVSPAAIITLFVAFFNMTEMNLAEFLVKVFRTYFLDEPRKFQVNYAKMDPIKIRIADIKSQEVKQTVVEKKAIDKTKLQDLDSII